MTEGSDEKEKEGSKVMTGLDLEAEIDRKQRELNDLRQALELLKRQGYVMVVNSREPLPMSEEFRDMYPLEAIRVLLKRMGRASTRELHDALLAGGLRSRARNLINSIGVTMSKANDIVKDSGGAWRLKTPEEMREEMRRVEKH